MKGKIIIIDGVSNSGKTTLCNNLVNKDNILVEEVPKFVRNHPQIFNGQDMPPLPRNKEEELENQKFILNAEIERIKMAYYIVNSGKNAILDRSFLSTVAIAHSFDDCKNMSGTYMNALLLLKEYTNFIKNLMLDSKIDYIILVTDTKTVEERNNSREKILSKEWIDKELIEKQNNFFVCQTYFINVNLIDTTLLSTAEVLNEVNKKTLRKEVKK